MTADVSPKDGRESASLSHGKKWTFRILAVALGSGLAVVVFNAIFRRPVMDLKIELTDEPIYLQEPGHERTGHRYLYDEKLGWRNIPNWSATTNGHKLTINSNGLRDRNHAYAKPQGVKRILVLGDSFAWGYGVADGETFSDQFERLLNEKPLVPGEKYEVINTGVSGWGTDQEYLFLKQQGFRYEPDIVILAFFIVNDIHDSASSNQYGMQKPVFLNRRLELANVPVPRPTSARPPITPAEDPLDITIAIIERISRECRDRGCDFLMMKFGQFLPRYKTNPPLMEASQYLVDELKRLGPIRYLDLDKRFDEQGISAETLLRGNDDGHWNAEGHRIVAELLYDYLASKHRPAEN